MHVSKCKALRAGLEASVAIAALMAAPAFAQDSSSAAAADDTGSGGETIVVTGSLISNPNLERSTPVNVTTSDEVELRQTNVAEQLLREIPGVVPSIGSAVNNGNGGASYVDLRGLGSNRNVVLLDGNRIAPSSLVGRVDLNNIPLALIERTEVLTGGASTTYGADAVSGVVNFITKKDFSGLDLQLSEQVTERGDGNIFRADLTIGANLDESRGNVVFGIGYQEADPVYQSARYFSSENIDSFDGSLGGSGTAIPSRFSSTRPLAGGAPSTTAAFAQVGTRPDGTPILAANPGGAANGGTRQINAAGQAVAPFAAFNFNPYNVFQTPFSRFNMFGQARYEVSDGLEVYSRGLFSKNVVKTIIAPSGVFNSPVTVNLNNPYLPAALRNQFCALNVAPVVTGVDANGKPVAGQTTYTPLYTQAQCDAAANAIGPNDPNYRTVTTNLARRTTEVGPRISNFQTTVFDYRAGVRGNITDGIRWDASGSYGQSENTQTLNNYVLASRARQALLASRDSSGQIVCNDPSNGCVPADFFSGLSANQVPFLTASSSTTVRTSLAQARAVVSGDSGVALPWAGDSVNFALGGEYRKYRAEQRSDTLAKTAGELGGAGGAAPDTNGGFDVYEAFGELVAPIVQDKPFFKDLTVEAGVRYSHYTVDAPDHPTFNTTTWKVQGTWSPIDDLKFRGGYSRAVRAPNISELFAPVNTVLTNLATDPCAGGAPVANANLRAICLAQGAPINSIGSIATPSSGQINVTTGGNLALKPEKSNSLTAGFVVQPAFLPGFSASLDYYNIAISRAITTPTPGDLITACFGSDPSKPPANASTVACTSIRRNPVTGGLDGDASTTPGLRAPLSNLGRLKTDGIDLTMNYNTDLGFAKLALSFAGNWTHSSKFQAIGYANPLNLPLSLNRECVGYYSVNCSGAGGSIQPEFSWTQRTTLSFDNVDLSLLWRHISAVRQEPDDALNGNGPAFVGQVHGTSISSGQPFDLGFRDFGHIPSYDWFDLAARIGVGDNLTVTLTVANLFDKHPPVVGGTIGAVAFNNGNTYPSTYDALGRSYRVGARLRF